MPGASLVYQIGANTRNFESAMDRVRDVSENRAGKMLNSFQRSATGINTSMAGAEQSIRKVDAAATQTTSTFESMRGPVDALVTGLAALDASRAIVVKLTAALFAAQQRMENILQIVAGSAGAGVGTTFFQSLTAQAKDMGIEAGQLVTMLNKAREASTVRIGEGEGATNASAFGNRLTQQVRGGNLAPADREAYDAAETQEQRIRAVLDLIDKLKAAQKDIAAQDLGRSFFGEDFEKLALNGIDMVGAFRKALDGLQTAGGVRVVTPEEIQRTQDLNDKLKEVNNSWTRILKLPLEDIAYAQDLMAKSSAEWQQKVVAIAESFITIYARAREIGIAIKQWGQGLGIISQDFDAPKPKDDGGALRISVNPKKDRSGPLPSLRPKAASTTEEQDAVEAYIRQLGRIRDVAQAELENVGKTNVEREKAIALARAEAAARDDAEKGRRDSPKLDDDEKSRVLAAAEATAKLKDQTSDLQQKLRESAETMRTFGQIGVDAIADMITEGKGFDDVLGGIAKQLARSALQAAFLGTGPLAGLFGTSTPASAGTNAVGGLVGLLGKTFAGGFADGGTVPSGQWAVVGERGPEILAPSAVARQVVPNIAIPSLAARGGGGAVVNYSPTIDARGSTMGPGEMRAILDTHARQMRSELPGLIKNARSRGSI